MPEDALMLYDEKGRRMPLMFSDELMSPESGGAAGGGIDLRAVWSAIYRNRGMILVAICVSLAIGLAVTMLTRPIYRAGASIQIEQQTARVLEGQDTDAPAAMQDADRFLQTQLDIIHSRSLAEHVADSLNLYRNDDFLVAMGMRLRAIGGSDAPMTTQQRREIAVRLLQGNMNVNLPRSSRVASITFDSPDPATAARVANSFADNFIISNLQRKYDASSYARNFLQQQLVEAKQRLEDAERASIAYARSAQLIDASAGSAAESGEGGGRSLVTSSLVQINTSLSGAVAARIAAQQRWQQAQATPVMSLPEVQNNVAIQSLVGQRAQLQASYQQQLQQRKEDYPAMRQAAAQITELNQQIARLAGLVRTSIRDQYEISAKQEAALRGDLNNLKGQTLAEQDRGVRFNILRREADTSRTLYDGLLQRYKEVSAAAGVATNNISIVDRAEVPKAPVLPRPLLNLALAGLVGATVALLLVLLRETFDDAIRSPEDVDRKLGTALIGSVPLLPADESPSAALAKPRSGFSEAHYALRSSLEFASSTGLPRTLLCTSSQAGEGKSTTAAALAQSFGRIGRRVLLIDADLRKPSLHRLLNLSSTPGLSNVLTRQASWESVVQTTDTPNLDFMACGPLPPNPGELLASASIKELLDDLTKRYDLILIDAAPVMGLADAPLLASVVEGVVFVIEASRAHRGQAKIALRRLRESRAIIIGAVLTKFDVRDLGYAGDYGYSYNYGEGGSEKSRGMLGRRFKLPKQKQPDEQEERDEVA